MQIEAIATNDNSEDGKPCIRSVDAVNINLTQPSYTQTTLTGIAASQPGSSSQVRPSLLVPICCSNVLMQLAGPITACAETVKQAASQLQ